MSTIKVGEEFVRGWLPISGTREQRIAWARAANRACIVLHLTEKTVVTRHPAGPVTGQPIEGFETIWTSARFVGDGAKSPDEVLRRPAELACGECGAAVGEHDQYRAGVAICASCAAKPPPSPEPPPTLVT